MVMQEEKKVAQVKVDRFLRSELSDRLKIHEKMLLVILASYTGNKTDCYPSIQTLAIKCSMSESSVKTYIKHLEKKELIKPTRSKGEKNHYTLFIPRCEITGLPDNQVIPHPSTLSPGDPVPSHTTPPNNISNNIKEYTSLGKSKRSSLKNKKTTFPELFAVEEAHREKSTLLGLDVDSELEAFKEYYVAKGSTFANWSMAFLSWLRKAATFSKPKLNNTYDQMAGVCNE